jgi:hypothetical protein
MTKIGGHNNKNEENVDNLKAISIVPKPKSEGFLTVYIDQPEMGIGCNGRVSDGCDGNARPLRRLEAWACWAS